MSTYTANIIKDADTTTPTSGTWTVPEADDAIREVKRIMAYEAGVTAVSSYPYTILTTDNTLYCTSAGGTVAAPQLSTVCTTGVEKRIVVINDSSAAVTFDPYSTETVGGASTYDVAVGTIAEFLGHGGTDWEIIRGQAVSLHDGTAFRSASATPAANTVVVSNASSESNYRATGLAMTGEASTSGTSQTLTLDIGSVTSGDRIFLTVYGTITWTGTSISNYGQISKASGTATIAIIDTQTTPIYGLNYNSSGNNASGVATVVIKVTGTGTLVMQNYLSQVGGNRSILCKSNLCVLPQKTIGV